MALENDPQAEADIQRAVQAANQKGLAASDATGLVLPENPLSETVSDTLAHGHSCPLTGLRYALLKCALSAQKSPWQTLAILFLTIACGWLCVYFGATVFLGWCLYALFAEE